MVSEDTASSRIANNVIFHAIPCGTPGQADTAAVLGIQTDVLDETVGDSTVGDSLLHRGIPAGEQNAVGPPGLGLEIANGQMMEPEASGIAAADTLMYQGIVFTVQCQMGKFHVFTAVQGDENTRFLSANTNLVFACPAPMSFRCDGTEIALIS